STPGPSLYAGSFDMATWASPEREEPRGPDCPESVHGPQGLAEEEPESRSRRVESPRKQDRKDEVSQLAGHQGRDEEGAQEVRPQAHDLLSGGTTHVRLAVGSVRELDLP